MTWLGIDRVRRIVCENPSVPILQIVEGFEAPLLEELRIVGPSFAALEILAYKKLLHQQRERSKQQQPWQKRLRQHLLLTNEYKMLPKKREKLQTSRKKNFQK